MLRTVQAALATPRDCAIAKLRQFGEIESWSDVAGTVKGLGRRLTEAKDEDQALVTAILLHPSRRQVLDRWIERVRNTSDIELKGLLLGMSINDFIEIATTLQGTRTNALTPSRTTYATTVASASGKAKLPEPTNTNNAPAKAPTSGAEQKEVKSKLSELGDDAYIARVRCTRQGCLPDEHPYYWCPHAPATKLEQFLALRSGQMEALRLRDRRLFPSLATLGGVVKGLSVASALAKDLAVVTTVTVEGERRELMPKGPKQHAIVASGPAGTSEEVQATVDTGSAWTLISEGLAGRLGLPQSEPINLPVTLADGTTTTLSGPVAVVTCEVAGLRAEQRALVRPDDKLPEQLLLSNGLSEALGLAFSGHVSFCTPETVLLVTPEPAKAFEVAADGLREAVPLEVKELLDENERTTGVTSHVVTLPFKGAPPVQESRPRQGHSKHHAIILKEHEALLAEGKVVPCRNPKWVSTYHVVEQTTEAGGVKHRLVFNYQKLNEHMVVPALEALDISSILTTISQGRYFAKLDGKSAYLQLPVTEEHQPYLCYELGGEFFMFRFCPFGLSAMPAIFQSFATRLCEGLKVAVYLDDFVMYGDTVEELQQTVMEVLRKCNAENYRLSTQKSVLCSRSLNALGRVVTHGRVSPDPHYLVQVGELPLPRTLKQLRSCLGSFNWVAEFVAGAAQLAAPLVDFAARIEREHADEASSKASRKRANNKTLPWSEELIECFRRLIESTKSAVALRTLDPARPLKAFVDASTAGYGAVLLQDSGGPEGMQIVGLLSRKFAKSQAAWSVHKKETYALMAVVTRYWPFMRGADIYTDHSALVDLVRAPDNTRITNGWVHTLASSGARVHYVQGQRNAMADWLSRVHTLDTSEVTPLTLLQEANAKAGPPWLASGVKGLKPSEAEALARTIGQKASRAERATRRQATTDLVAESARTIGQRAEEKPLTPDQEAVVMDQWNRVLEPPTIPAGDDERDSDSTQETVRAGAREAIRNSELEVKILDEFPRLRLRQVDDPDERSRLMQETHARIAHRDARTLVTALMTIHEVWWPSMAKDCKSFHDKCNVCATVNAGVRVFAPARPIMPSEPMALLGMDVKGPLRKAPDGSQYILVLVDYCTSYVIAIPLPDLESATIERELRHVFMLFGFPLAVMSDNAASLKGDVDALLSAGGVKRLFSIPYLPRTNGKAEAAVKIIANGIAKLAMDPAAPEEWPERARIAATAYNEVVRTAAGCSPFQLMFGRRYLNQSDAEAVEADDERRSRIDWAQVQLAWQLAMEDHKKFTLPAARTGEMASKTKAAAATDGSHRTNDSKLPVDALVKVLAPAGEEHKWTKESYFIHGINSSGAYILRSANGEVIDRLFSRDQLKRTSAQTELKKASVYARVTAREEKHGTVLLTVIRRDNKLSEVVPASEVPAVLVKEYEARIRRVSKTNANQRG